MTSSTNDKRPLWAKCVNCAHCWAVAYFPMEMAEFARISLSNSAACPKCGAGGAVVAKQTDGVLQEPKA